MKYTMQIMNDKEFDQLPYKDVETSFGIADPKTKTAYVRRTGLKPLDTFNAMHELEHLEEGKAGKYASHYRNGVYYKNFGDVIGQIAPWAASMIPGVGPILGGAMGATKNFGLSAPSVQKTTEESPSTASYGGSMPQQQQVALSPNVSQAQSASTSTGGQTGSAFNMEKLRGMISGRNPQGDVTSQFGITSGTGRMA